MNSLYKVLSLFSMLLFSVVVDATSPPPQPTCSRTTEVTGDNGTYQQVNYACQRQWDVYSVQKSYYDQAVANGKKDNYQGDAAPVAPQPRNCSADDSSCHAQEQREKRDYDYQKEIYDRTQQAITRDAAAAADKAKAQSASQAYADLANQNQSGAGKYAGAAQLAGTAGSGFISAAMACQASPGATCAPPNYKAAAVAFGIMALASSQKNRMDKSAYAACVSGNQTSATQSNCGEPPPPDVPDIFDHEKNPIVTGKGPDGKCLPNAPASCKDDPPGGGTGTRITTGRGNSGFSSERLKITKNGDVTFPDGTKGNVYDMLTKEGMIAAGMTSAQADALIKQLGIDALTKGIDPKKELKDLANKEKEDAAIGDGSATGGGAQSISVQANQLNGNGTGVKGLKRDPAAEGLTKNFNGEAIGAAGDDIFSMMNRRYKLKTSQDSFLTPVTP